MMSQLICCCCCFFLFYALFEKDDRKFVVRNYWIYLQGLSICFFSKTVSKNIVKEQKSHSINSWAENHPIVQQKQLTATSWPCNRTTFHIISLAWFFVCCLSFLWYVVCFSVVCLFVVGLSVVCLPVICLCFVCLSVICLTVICLSVVCLSVICLPVFCFSLFCLSDVCSFDNWLFFCAASFLCYKLTSVLDIQKRGRKQIIFSMIRKPINMSPIFTTQQCKTKPTIN